MTVYYPTYADALNVLRDSVEKEYPEARIVRYEKGYAVQYYKSGPYFPDKADPYSPYNPANWT